jgi:sterol O-acyltransferase
MALFHQHAITNNMTESSSIDARNLDGHPEVVQPRARKPGNPVILRAQFDDGGLKPQSSSGLSR